jgi:YegS/Rv2252/BmrU family lipid kinase
MRRAALIYNPSSGRWRGRRKGQIEAALTVLRQAGVAADAFETRGPGSAGEQAREAVRGGCDAVLACGGDGTVHEVLQGMVGGEAALGVIPLGTANALAVDLGLPSSPGPAASLLLLAQPVRIAVGRIVFQDRAGATQSRYFTVAAGIGADADVMYRLDANLKRTFGYAAYVAESLRVWATHRYPWFQADLCLTGDGAGRTEAVSQLLAVRIGNFGGILRNLAPGATLQRDDLRLVAFKTRSRWSYLRFMLGILAGRLPRLEKIELLDATSVVCRDSGKNASRIYVEADGELLGTLPARIEVVPRALRLLMPYPSGSVRH